MSEALPQNQEAGESMDEKVAVRVRSVTKRYRAPRRGLAALRGWVGLERAGDAARPALEDVDFEIMRGEAVGIVGRNGSGKSTLLKMLADTLSPTKGTIEVFGRVSTLLDLGSGIDPEYTGVENARVLGLLAGFSRAETEIQLDEVRQFSGLGDAFDRPAKGYSSGMLMRLGFSTSILGSPDVLLIDEALAVGDAFFQQRCLRRMRELKDSGTTIVLVSHDPSAVISLCDRCLWLESGRIVSDGSPADVIKEFLAARYADACELDQVPLARSDLSEAAVGEIRPAQGFAVGSSEGNAQDRFGDGRARVVGADVRDSTGASVGVAQPGELIDFVITVRAQAELTSPLVGVTLRNRLGDVVSATNTEVEGVVLPALSPGDEIDVSFRLAWPALTSGAIVISPAVADGNVAAHNMCDWVENALVLECQNPNGLFGWISLEGVSVEMGRVRSEGEAPNEAGKEASGDLDANPATIEEGPDFAFALESPVGPLIEVHDVTREGGLFFRGWAFSPEETKIEIEVRVGEAAPARCTPCSFRDDVATVHDGILHSGRSGFGVIAPLPDQAGRTSVRISGHLPDGRERVLAEFELDLPAVTLVVDESKPPRRVRSEPASPSNRRRVLFATHSLRLEGAPIALLDVAAAIDPGEWMSMGWSPSEGPLDAAWAEANLEMATLLFDPFLGGADDFDAQVRRVAAMVAVRRPDVIVANTLDAFWSIHVARELGLPAIWIIHESEDPQTYFHSRLSTAIADRAMETFGLADELVFVAEATRQLFTSVLRPDRSRVIPNGLWLERFALETKEEARQTVREQLGLAEETPLVLCAGTTCARKGQFELVRALSLLRDRHPTAHCVLLGVVEGDYAERIRSVIQEAGLEAQVSMLAHTPDPRPFFAAADVVACPSFQESLPRVIQEGMAFGIPIVATDVFGIPELVRDGEEGLIVAAGDIEGMAQAFDRLLSDPTHAKRLGEAGRARVQSEYRQRLTGKRYEELFEDVLARDQGRSEW